MVAGSLAVRKFVLHVWASGHDGYFVDELYSYMCSDRPGLEGPIVIGQRPTLKMDFVGEVVLFDKPVFSPRKILRTIAKRTWSYQCTRTVVSASPLVTVPY